MRTRRKFILGGIAFMGICIFMANKEYSIQLPYQMTTDEEEFELNIDRASIRNITSNHGKKYHDELWDVSNEETDRILELLAHTPDNYNANLKQRPKLIYSVNKKMNGRDIFIEERCPVNNCIMQNLQSHHNELDSAFLDLADALVFHGFIPDQVLRNYTKPPYQVWILFMLESPIHTGYFIDKQHDRVNWTATYRRDSTIVTPYGKYAPVQTYTEEEFSHYPKRDYSAGKTKGVAWFVSNCDSANDRMSYATELAKYIEVDIMGICTGRNDCPRNKHKDCIKMLNRDYRLYLSFENSNCRHYITEKFINTALENDFIPIVMGATKDDYLKVSPPHSFIHVDDFSSPKELATYLHLLIQDKHAYNRYFAWKHFWKPVETRMWCRICTMLNMERPPMWIPDIRDWWRGPETCVEGRWTHNVTYKNWGKAF